MFRKNFWMPLVIFLIGVAIGGTFWRKHIMSQEPMKVYKTTPLPTQRQGVNQTPEGTEAEGGHFHADGTWHAPPHTSIVLPGDTVSPAAVSPAEDTTSALNGLTLGQVVAERGTDIYNIDLNAIPPDFRRKAQYFRDKKVWLEKWNKANTEWFQAGETLDNIGPRDAEEYAAYIRSLSETEKLEHASKLEDALKKYQAARKNLDAVSQEEPVYPNEEN